MPEAFPRYLLSGGLFLAVMSYAVGLTLFGPAVSPIAESLGASEAAVGALYIWLSVGFLCATAFCWKFSAAGRLKPFAAAGSLGLAGGLYLVSTASSYPVAAAGMALFGIGGAFTEIAGNAAIVDLHPGRRTTALSFYHLMFGIAALAGPRLSGLLIAEGSGWRTAYLVAGVIALLPFPLLMWLPFPAVPAQRQEAAGVGPKRLWRNPLVLTVAAGIFFYVGAEISTSNWAALYLNRERGLEPLAGAEAVSNFWLSLTVGRLGMVYLATRFSPVRLLIGMSSLSLLCSVAFVLLPEGADQAVIAQGFCLSGVFATFFAVAVNRYPEASAEVSAILTAGAGLGILLLSPAIGYVNEWAGNFRGILLIPLYTAAMLVCALRLLRDADGVPVS